MDPQQKKEAFKRGLTLFGRIPISILSDRYSKAERFEDCELIKQVLTEARL